MMDWIKTHTVLLALLALLALAGAVSGGLWYLGGLLDDRARLAPLKTENQDLRTKAGIRKELNEIRNHRGTADDTAGSLRDGTF